MEDLVCINEEEYTIDMHTHVKEIIIDECL
jgi:hypothetical protein